MLYNALKLAPYWLSKFVFYGLMFLSDNIIEKISNLLAISVLYPSYGLK